MYRVEPILLAEKRLKYHAELTFIILAVDNFSRSDQVGDLGTLPMIGDVNLFLKGIPPHLRPPGSISENEDFEAELEIMIAGLSLILFQVPLLINVPTVQNHNIDDKATHSKRFFLWSRM